MSLTLPERMIGFERVSQFCVGLWGSEAPVKARRNGTAPQAGSAEDADHQADALKGKRAARKALTKADGKDPVGINSPLTGGRLVSVTQSEANPGGSGSSKNPRGEQALSA